MTYEFTPDQLAWIEALESGKYKQGTGVLKQNDQDGTACYCCLGLACEILDPAGFTPQAQTIPLKDGSKRDAYPYVGLASFLDESMVTRLQLNGTAGDCLDTDGKQVEGRDLAHLNDNGSSFAEIAQLLRQRPERYFDKVVS